MKEKMYKFILRSILSLILFSGFCSMTAYAGGYFTADIHYNMYDSYPEVCALLRNDYSNARYCEVYFLYGPNRGATATCAFISGMCGSGDTISTTDSPSGAHIWARGAIYNAGSPYAGVAWTSEKQVK